MNDVAVNFVRRGARIGGVAGAVAGGAIGGLPKTKIDSSTGKTRTRSTKERVVEGLLGAGAGAYAGRGAGRFAGALKKPRLTPSRPDWLKDAKNKTEAKAAWRAHARKTHPDRGGSNTAFNKAKSEWLENEPTFKTAMLNAFADELEKISSIGALLGGVAGYKLGPNSSKGKIVGSLVGAGLGHAIGVAGGAAKKQLVDEPHERDMRELYGYQPSAGQSF